MSSVYRYSFCESSSNTGIGPEHIRVVGAEGILLGGGVKGPTLCGRTFINGWDIPGDVNADTVFHDSTCRKCAELSLYNAN